MKKFHLLCYPLFFTLLETSLAAQSDSIDLDFKDMALPIVLDYIAETSDIGISYSSSSLVDPNDNPIKVTIRAKDLQPKIALEAVAEATHCALEEKTENFFVFKSKQEDVFADVIGPLLQTFLSSDSDEIELTEDGPLNFEFTTSSNLTDDSPK